MLVQNQKITAHYFIIYFPSHGLSLLQQKLKVVHHFCDFMNNSRLRGQMV